MARYQKGDILCSAVETPEGKYRARVRVAGPKLQPPSSIDYEFQSQEQFMDQTTALNYAVDHANEFFPLE